MSSVLLGVAVQILGCIGKKKIAKCFSAQLHRLLKTFGPKSRLSECMESGRFGVGAIWMPFLHCSFKFRPMPRAGDSDMQPLDHGAFWDGVDLLTAWDFVDTLKVHAPCCKLLFTILTEVCVVSVMNRQPRLAIVHVCQKLTESQARENLYAAMEAHPDVFAIFHVYTAVSNHL